MIEDHSVPGLSSGLVREGDDAPRRERLLAEARLLAELIKQHVADRQLARERKRTPIYFIDSHELKIYLNASGGADNMRGFVLDAEQTLLESADPDWSHLNDYLRLKSEQMLHWLLFAYPNPVVVLPSHAAEIDDEIGYRTYRLMTDTLGLMRTAKAELARLRSSSTSMPLLKSMVDSAAESEKSRRWLFDYLEKFAPALSVLIRDDPDTMKVRLESLLQRSNVVNMQDVPWERFGLDAETCEEIRGSSVDDSLAHRWQDVLGKERSNSFQANRLDSEAIAQLTSLNQMFRRREQPFQAVLVTRAMTLISLLRQANLKEELRHEAGNLLRHSRLTIIAPEDLPQKQPGTERSEDGVAEALEQLEVALSIYVKQLGDPRSAHLNWFNEAQSLVEAFHKFEAARYTVELAGSTEAQAKAHIGRERGDGFHRLLAWLRSEKELEAAVIERLNETVALFNEKVFQIDEETGRAMRALVMPGTHWGHLRVQPIHAQLIGPFEFESSSFNGHFASENLAPLRVAELPSIVESSRDIAEQYVVRALRHAVAGKLQMASNYADGALRSAEILGRHALKEEAALLFAQAVRMEIAVRNWTAHEEDRKILRARRVLSNSALWKRDPRFHLEASALRLEGLLKHLSWTDLAKKVDEGLDELKEAVQLVRTPQDDTRIAELALLYLIAMIDRPGSAYENIDLHVKHFHETVVSGLSELRTSAAIEESGLLRPRLRGVEIAGYELLGQDIPLELQLELHDLQGELGRNTDRASRSVLTVLQRISSKTDLAREYNLAYAPIWSRADTEQVFRREIHDEEVRTAALEAVRIVHSIGKRCGLGAGVEGRKALATARDLFELSQSRIGLRTESSMAAFQLKMEYCYGRLLECTLETDFDQRRALFQTLCDDYRDMLESHPDSAILHFRHSIVLGELDRHDESFGAIKSAMQALSNDPHVAREHWVSSTIARRMAYHFANQAREVSERMKANPADQALADQYRRHLRDAFTTIYPGFDAQREPDDLLASLESHRRLNNIVYYACLYTVAGGELADLAEGFDRARLITYVMRLHPQGLDRVSEWTALHTIGYAYHALEMHAEALAAADALWGLIGRIGTTTQSVGIRNALDDALNWKRQAGHASLQ